MGRPKAKNQTELFTNPVRTRLTETSFKRLEKLRVNSSCQTVGEVARMILSAKEIKVFTKDITMDSEMEELTSIRKELKAIGVNINQQTRYFNSKTSNDAQRTFYMLKTAELYKKVEVKIDRLLCMVAKLSEKWLSK